MSASIPLHGYNSTPLFLSTSQTDDLEIDSSHQPSKQPAASTTAFSILPSSLPEPHPSFSATALGRPHECGKGGSHVDSSVTSWSSAIPITLLYSSVVVYLLTLLGFGYDMGFSSPALHDLSQNSGKHTFFNRTIYRDAFNVSEASCWI